MSAICGVYYKNVKRDTMETETMFNEFGNYNFDVSRVWSEERTFLGCHHKYVTPESLEEVLPFCDRESNLVITADAIIDNREEIIDMLYSSKLKKDIPDSILILEAYKKWGYDCVKKLAGDFAFAIWDKRKKELFCARDQVGKRTFYYFHSKEVFAFSTLLKPFFKLKYIKKALNDRYVADFLAMPIVSHELDANITIYKDIFQLPPANIMVVRQDSIKIWEYWRVERTKEIKFSSDAEYEEAFREVFFEAVHCRLRSVKPVGIMLSGGLDSSSVASVAAKELKKRGEKLYGFTQIPIEGYKEWLPKDKLADESEFVREICKFSENIEPNFIDAKGKNSYTEINKLINILEQPYKFFTNSHWLNEILIKASEKNIGVLLDGQSGNATISWGQFTPYINYLLAERKYKTYIEEVKAFSKITNKSCLKTFISSLLNVMPCSLIKFQKKLRGKWYSIEEASSINSTFSRQMDMDGRFKEFDFNPLLLSSKDSQAMMKIMLKPNIFSHLGAIETKTSIESGITKRDPTRDYRIIEFCINVPESQWVKNGETRSLIRRSMEGYLPDKVRLNYNARGFQAADWFQRLECDWGNIQQEIKKMGNLQEENMYLDISKIKKSLDELEELELQKGINAIIKMHININILMTALIFSRFLNNEFYGGKM